MRWNREAGQALVTAALGLIVLIGFAGLGIDMGVMRYEKRLQQSAADAAAVAGAEQIPLSGSYASAGQEASALNGFTDNGGGEVSTCTASGAAVNTICVQINNPPQSGPHASCSTPCDYVEALVSEVHPTFFMRIFGRDTATVTSRAVATMVNNQGGTNGCIWTLGPVGSTGIGGVLGTGTPTVTAPTCGLEDNGDFTTNGTKLDIQMGAIGVVGAPGKLQGTVTPTPTYNLPPVSDPLSYLTPPTVGSAVAWTGNPVPGTTYSGIKINNGQVVNFPAGTYVIDGGAFQINGGATVCNQTGAGCSATGTPNAGVTFYLTNGASLTTNGKASIYLAAPNSNPYEGILFYQDPSDCSTATMDGTANSYYQGALYFPGNPGAGCNVELDFGGTLGNTTAAYTVIVTDDLKFNGTSAVTINSDYSSLPGGVFPIKNAVLVE